MRRSSVVLGALVAIAAPVAGVLAFQSSAPAPTRAVDPPVEASVSAASPPDTVVRYRPCGPRARLEDGVCITHRVQLVMTAPSGSTPTPAAPAGADPVLPSPHPSTAHPSASPTHEPAEETSDGPSTGPTGQPTGGPSSPPSCDVPADQEEEQEAEQEAEDDAEELSLGDPAQACDGEDQPGGDGDDTGHTDEEEDEEAGIDSAG